MSGGDCGSALGGILGVLRLKLGLPWSCFVLYMKVVKVANGGGSLVVYFKMRGGRGLPVNQTEEMCRVASEVPPGGSRSQSLRLIWTKKDTRSWQTTSG